MLPAVIVLVFAQLVTLFTLLFLMAGGRVTAADSAAYVFGGEVALAFWLGVVGNRVGAAAGPRRMGGRPKRMDRRKIGERITANGSRLLVGGIVLRYAILSGGASVAATLGPR